MYDPRYDTFLPVESLPSKRSVIAAVSVDGNIYVIGGESTEATLDQNKKYDPKTDSWDEQSSMPTARHGLAVIVIDDKVYAIGGGPDPVGYGSDTNEIYQIN